MMAVVSTLLMALSLTATQSFGMPRGIPRYHDYRRRIPEIANCAEAYSQKVTGMLVLSPAPSCEVVPLTRIDLTRVQSTASDILH